MQRSEIERIVKSYIEQDLSGQEVENPKCDFKAKWYDLKALKGINEFLKDTSAIANTFGPDGLIIIGYDSGQKTFLPACFSDSKLRDTSELSDIINKRVDRLFDIAVYEFSVEGNPISVLHIPPSIDKPHVIKNYQTMDKRDNIREEQHKIFVRKNTSTYPASKYDIELMFYDRKNIIPDYKILCSYHVDTLQLNATSHHNGSERQISDVKAGVNLVFENLGKRPVAINEIHISISFFGDPSPHEVIHFTTDNLYRGAEIIVLPNQIKGVMITLRSEFHKHNSHQVTQQFLNDINERKRNLLTDRFTLILSTGEKLRCDLIKVM